MPRYFILSQNSSVFWDQYKRVKITQTEESDPYEHKGPISQRMALALKSGHIKEVKAPTKTSVEKPSEPVEEKVNFKKMKSEELDAYYKENFDVSDEDVKAFSEFKLKDKIKFLEEN